MERNIGGCDALNEKTVYDTRKAGKKAVQMADKPWWCKGKINIALAIIFSIMDGTVLFSIFDTALTQSKWMGLIMTAGIAVVLNFIPLILAKFVHARIEKTQRYAGLMVGMLIGGFILLFGTTVYLRFSFKDSYEQESTGDMLVNQVVSGEAVLSDEQTIESDEKDNAIKKSNAIVLVLSISPLITSLLGFAIAYVTDDPARNKIEQLEIELIETDEKIADTQAAIMQLEEAINAGVEKDLEYDKQSMDAALEEIKTRCDILKARARLYLAQYLADPSATTKLTEEMMSTSNSVENNEYTEKVPVEDIPMLNEINNKTCWIEQAV